MPFGESFGVSIEYLPEYVAQHGGFWKQLGLDITPTPFQGSGAHVQAISSGQVQMGEISYVGLINGQTHQVPITAIAMGIQQADFVLIVSKNSKYTSATQLRGATIGVTTAGSATDMMFNLLAARYNFTIGKDIFELHTGNLQAQLAALTTNQSQGFFQTYETGYQLQTSGDGRILLDMSQAIPNWAENVIYATNSLISQNPALVRKVVQGYFNAIAYMEKNRPYAIQMAQQYMGLSPAAANLTISRAFSPDQFGTTGEFTPQVVAGMSVERAIMLKLNVVTSLIPVNQTYTTQFVPVTPQNVTPLMVISLPPLFIAATRNSVQ